MTVRPTQKTLTLAIVFPLTLSGLLCLSGCQKQPAPTVTSKPIPISQIIAEPRTEAVWIETLGRAQGQSESEVRAQVSGILTDITYSEGEAVKKGQVLFVLDDGPYRAALEAASATVRQTQADLTQCSREAARSQALFAARATSEKARDDALSALSKAQASLAAAVAKEKEARINLERTRITAPADGTVARAQVNRGALVSATSTLLTTLTQPDALRVNFSVSERDLAGARITRDSAVRLWVNTEPAQTARLDYVSRQIDTANATLSLRAALPADSAVLAGQLVHVQLQTQTLNNVFRVPQSAVVQKPDGSYSVFINKAGKAQPVTVTLGTWKDSDWIVLSGLHAKDAVITNQIQRLKAGAAVKVLSTP